MIQRGRPKKKQRMVALIVMVPPEIKKGLKNQAKWDNITMSQLVRTLLESFKGEYE